MLLKNKVAVIFAAGGAVGGKVVQEFAREGATLFLSGHRLESVKRTAQEIGSTEARVTVEQIDALNQDEVNAYRSAMTPQHMLPLMRKQMPPNIFFSVTNLRGARSLRIRSASRWSKGMGFVTKPPKAWLSRVASSQTQEASGP